MKIKMKQDKLATANEAGSATFVYKKDSELDMSEAWQIKLASNWLNHGVAEQVKPVTEKKVVTEVQKKEKKSIVKKIFGKKK
jgi:hypothetical protein|tara:strand:- start:2240 stop:2485 length:246 start_codon:yes stop_codon:yes gene_type:complete